MPTRTQLSPTSPPSPHSRLRADDEVEVIAKVLQHLPLYTPTAELTSKSKQMGQWVSSVYLDSPDFESYR